MQLKKKFLGIFNVVSILFLNNIYIVYLSISILLHISLSTSDTPNTVFKIIF